jgi:hypothetical protein
MMQNCFMQKQIKLGKQPKFYKEPTDAEIESGGRTAAEIKARTHARIIGSRVLSVTVAASIGTAITTQEILSEGNISIINIIGNFGIPILINTAAELKTERQLRHMGQELIRVLSMLEDANETITSGTSELS